MNKDMKTYIVLLVTLVLAIVLFLTGSKVVKHKASEHQDEISTNVEHLAVEEAGSVQTASAGNTVKESSDEAETTDGLVFNDEDDETEALVADSINNALSDEDEQRKILALMDEECDYAQIRKWFNGNIIAGDSIAQAAIDYGFLDYSVDYAEIGVTAETGRGEVEQAIMMAPPVLILSFGVNDIENDTLEDFIAHYRARISEVQSAIPDTKLFIHSIFPPINGLENELTFYQNIDAYNGALKELCAEMNVPLVDGSFILTNRQDLYDGDGVHPLPKFYHLWLTYLADVTGLSDE